MGWFGTKGGTRQELIDECLAGDEKDCCIAHCTVGNHLWQVRECNEEAGTRRYIVLSLLARAPYGWMEKTMDEGMGPYYYTCPLSYLEMAPLPAGETNTLRIEWRDLVRAAHVREGEKPCSTRY